MYLLVHNFIQTQGFLIQVGSIKWNVMLYFL